MADECVRGGGAGQVQKELQKRRRTRWELILAEECRDLSPCPMVSPLADDRSLYDLLRETDAGFSETLLRLIDGMGKKDSEIYKKDNADGSCSPRFGTIRHISRRRQLHWPTAASLI